MILAIDPGPEQSAILEHGDGKIHRRGIFKNDEALSVVGAIGHHTVIEMVASYGMPVGADVFETVYWIGRFAERAPSHDRVFRLDVKVRLCHDSCAKDANIRQALIDRFPATGGGKTPQIGTKHNPGPLYGMKSHLWAALAVAITYEEMRNEAINTPPGAMVV